MARALIVAASLFAAVAQESGPDVHYVANSGMLVTVSGRRFLIDAPIRDGISGHPTSSAEERARLESAQTPQDRVDAILITHWSAEANRQLVADAIRPRRIVAMHASSDDARKVEAALRAANVRVTIAAQPGSRLSLEK